MLLLFLSTANKIIIHCGSSQIQSKGNHVPSNQELIGDVTPQGVATLTPQKIHFQYAMERKTTR